MMLLLSVLVCLFLGANSQYTKCGDGRDIVIGESSTICFHIANKNNWADGINYVRLSFAPKADEYSRLHIPNSYKDLVNLNSQSIFYERDISLSAAVQDKFSFVRQYYDYNRTRIFPYYTAIIDVEDGKVRGITWDDACIFCAEKECKENTFNYNGVPQDRESSGQPTQGCFKTENECNDAIASNVAECDLTFYVVWTGTDANGVAFQSSAFRFSQFPLKELKDRLSDNVPDWRQNDQRRLAVDVPMDL